MEASVLVYGTNPSGYWVAYALGKMGYKVILLNRGRYVDEIRNQVLAQLPLDFCWICVHMPQRLFIALGTLQVLYNAEILGVEGSAGNFKVKVRKRDPFVNNFACTECGACVRACPVEVDGRKAIYEIPEVGWENIFLIDEEHCTKCGACEEACPTGALKLDRPEEEVEISVKAIVLAPEFEEPGEEELEPFGWGKVPNVVRNSDIARSSLLTNFVRNALARPSDGKLPERVAIIVTPHFNRPGAEFESYNCCVNALYRAHKVKEVLPQSEVVVFLRDFRGPGKGHYRWYERVTKEGVEIVRTRRLTVSEGKDGEVLVRHQRADGEEERRFDLAILVTGQRPPRIMERLSTLLGVRADENGFCWTRPFSTETNVDGIFAVGEFTGPKGVPELIWEGYGTAAEVRKYLDEPEVKPPPPPSLRDVSGEPVRTGVFICSCFGEFERKMDLKGLAEEVRKLPTVSHVEIVKGCCTPPTMEETAERIKASGVNRVVLAVCTPLQKLLKFRRTVMKAGLSPLLAEFIRLREDVINVHEDPSKMQKKALALIAGAVEKLRRAEHVPAPAEPITSRAVVIGGGVAGMTTALLLADNGVEVELVERSGELGGKARELYRDLMGRDIRAFVSELVEKVEGHPRITVRLNAEVEEASGHLGRYRLLVREGDERFWVEAGAIVIAVGAKESEPKGFLYGEDPRVITQKELARRINEGEVDAKRVVMIQCVNSRDDEHPYCSRFCCAQALRNALDLRERGAEVTILYRDLNAYGTAQEVARKAEEAGVKFVRFDASRYPEVKASEKGLTVKVCDAESGKEEEVEADLVVLSVGVVPDEETYRRLSQMLNYPLDKDGFFDTETSVYPFEEAIKKLTKPFEVGTNGIFPVGLAHSPRGVAEAVLTAKSTAGRILAFLTKPKLAPPNMVFVSAVREARCVGCGICVEVCPYFARVLDEDKKVARVIPHLCDACGTCVASCPSEASYLTDFRSEQIVPALDALLNVG